MKYIIMLKSKCVLNKETDKGLDEMTNVAHSLRRAIKNASHFVVST